MAPIRIGLIGLAATDSQSPMGTWGVHAHLRSIKALAEEFELVAVANSTVESAQRSIEFHSLPSTVKAYGSPEEIAADPNVELVVVSVEVTKHFSLAVPALKQKKSIFVEWPLGATPKEAQQLSKLASENNVKTMVGVQGRSDPFTQKIKEILQSGRIGKVTSTTVTICGTLFAMDHWYKGKESFLDIKSGGNEFTILFGHFLDSFVYLLGDFAELHSCLKSHYDSIPIMDTTTGQITGSHPKSAPDHIFVQGVLESGALASLSYRKPRSFCADDAHTRWFISGTEGEIMVTTDEQPWQSSSSATVRSIKVKSSGSTNVEEIKFTPENDSLAAKVPQRGTNTARQYAAFANGGEIATFESALKTHQLLERIARSAGLSLSSVE